MKNTTLKEYVFKLPMEEYNTIVLVFYYGINILTGTPQKIFDSVTPNIFVKDTKKINHSREDLIIVDVDIDESEVRK